MLHKMVRMLCSVLAFFTCMLPAAVPTEQALGAGRTGFYVMGMESLLQAESQRMWTAVQEKVLRQHAVQALIVPERALRAVLSGEAFGRFLQDYSPHFGRDQNGMRALCRLSGIMVHTDRSAVEAVLRMREYRGSG